MKIEAFNAPRINYKYYFSRQPVNKFLYCFNVMFCKFQANIPQFTKSIPTATDCILSLNIHSPFRHGELQNLAGKGNTKGLTIHKPKRF